MKKIYIAGKLRDEALPYIDHLREMCLEADKVQVAGFLTYVPAWDLLQALVVGNKNFTALFNNSYGFIDVCDAMYVVKSHYKSSKGTQREMAKAERLGIPIFFDLKDMQKHFEEKL